VLVDAPRQQFERRHALAAADDLAVALGRQAIARQAEPRVGRIGLHVERLHRGGIVRDEQRPVVLLESTVSSVRRSRRPTRRPCPVVQRFTASL
jgi:hypothetical protein